MKRFAFSLLLLASVALAGDYITGVFNQTGNGANGMTATAPSAATDGVAAQSGGFSIATRPVANSCVLTIQSDKGYPFVGHATQAVMRGWRYGLQVDGGGGFAWYAAPELDQYVDAGSLNVSNAGTLQFGPIPLPPSPSGTRYAFTGEQIHQGTTLDAGINVGIELFTPRD